MRLLLIRHGQTPANVDGVLSTDAPGPVLTELGTRQAAEIPRALAGDPIDGIYVSKLVRTQLTAAPLALERDLEAHVMPGIHEIEAGELEDRSGAEAVKVYLTTAFAWGTGELDPRMPGASNGHEFYERFDSDIATIYKDTGEGGTAVVVSHGAAIRVWVAGRATNVPPSFAGEHDIENTGVVELDGSPEAGWTLLSWQGTPVGGQDLADPTAEDPTGETLAEADAEANAEAAASAGD